MTIEICMDIGDFLILTGVVVGIIMILLYLVVTLSSHPSDLASQLGYVPALRRR